MTVRVKYCEEVCMAKLQPMRYKDYVWPHNPKSYTITYRRRMSVQEVPYGYYTMQSLGHGYRVMRGSGEFVGEGAYEEFKRLAKVYYTGGEGTLVHPCWQSAHVFFVKLAVEQVPRPDYVAYTFEFWESYDRYETELKPVQKIVGSVGGTKPSGGAAAVYHTVRKGETLWSIARKYHTTLAHVLALNRGLKNPNLIYAGQKVRVA